MATSTDILHPLATLYWEKGKDMRGQLLSTEAVLLGNHVYVGITRSSHSISNTKIPALYSIAADLSLWRELTIPSIEGFALSHYDSKLVLVGGRRLSSQVHEALNDVWVLHDEFQWLPSLPIMPTCRRGATAFNTGRPEYLIVAGGFGIGLTSRPLNVVEVLATNQWFSLCHLPKPCCRMQVTFHHSKVYLMGGPRAHYSEVFCRLSALMEACAQASAGGVPDDDLWEVFHSEHQAKSPVSFGDHLVDIEMTREDTRLHAYSPLTQSWVHVGDMPVCLVSASAVITSSGELVVTGRPRGSEKLVVMKTSLNMCPYDPESQFSASALARLEATGIQLQTSLDSASDSPKKLTLANDHLMFGDTVLPPTWGSLLDLLEKLYLDNLCDQIKKCLNLVKTLKEQCTSAITTALLQQRSLQPDDLQVRLPDHIPPATKRHISHTYRAYIHMLQQ